MLNMDRMVGTITPKNVFSCRGSLLGVPRLEPDAAFVPPPHTAEVTARPHTPEVIRGVRSFDMAAQQMFSAAPVERKSQRTGSDRRTFHLISLYISDTQFCFFTLSSTFVALWGGASKPHLHYVSVFCILSTDIDAHILLLLRIQ